MVRRRKRRGDRLGSHAAAHCRRGRKALEDADWHLKALEKAIKGRKSCSWLVSRLGALNKSYGRLMAEHLASEEPCKVQLEIPMMNVERSIQELGYEIVTRCGLRRKKPK